MNNSLGKSLQSIFCCTILSFMFALPCSFAADNSDQWNYQLALYGWLPGQKGSVATLPGLPVVDIDVDFWDDILGNIKGAFFLVGEARRDRFGFFMDIAYSDIEFEKNTPGPYFRSVSSRTKNWIITATGFYRLVDSPGASLDLLGGVRYWSVDSSLELSAAALQNRAVNNKEEWFDPLVGVKGLYNLGQSKFYLSGGLFLGGFGAASDFMWDANINLGYEWSQSISTTIGYRYLDVDYEDGDFLYDIAQNGPTIALSWRF